MPTLGTSSIRKSESEAILRSLAAGVTPLAGLHHTAVGRSHEVQEFLRGLDSVAQGGSGFKVVAGGYGTGKTFLMNLVGYLAMKAGFVVCRADISADRAFCGSGRGIALYRALIDGMATRTEPVGGALRRVLERWSGQAAASEEGLERVLGRVSRSLREAEGGYAFAEVLSIFSRGFAEGDSSKQEEALRWLRGEPMTKREAMAGLGVSEILTDGNWYPRIRLWADLARMTGYSGLVVLLDEGDMLYRISHVQTRDRNYEALLGIVNDSLQGRSPGLYFILSATPGFVSDKRRGMAACEPLRTRLSRNPLEKGSLKDLAQPVMYLEPLAPEELVVLLLRVSEIHAVHYGRVPLVDDRQAFVIAEAFLSRPGAKEFGTVRELLREFVGGLNLLQQNPSASVSDVFTSIDGVDPVREAGGDPFAGFQLHKS